MLPRAMSDLYIMNNKIHMYGTRQKNLIHIPDGAHTDNFRYKSVLVWNELTIRGMNSEMSLPKYKKSLKHYLQFHDLTIGYAS